MERGLREINLWLQIHGDEEYSMNNTVSSTVITMNVVRWVLDLWGDGDHWFTKRDVR